MQYVAIRTNKKKNFIIYDDEFIFFFQYLRNQNIIKILIFFGGVFN